MGEKTYIAYLVGRKLTSEEFRRAATEAPVEVLFDAYKRVAAGGRHGQSYAGRMTAIHNAVLSRIMVDVGQDKQLRSELAAAAEQAARMSLNQDNPIYVYVIENRVGQGVRYPDGARWIIKCQRGKKYGYRPAGHRAGSRSADNE